MKYEVRNLSTKDLYTLARVLGRVGKKGIQQIIEDTQKMKSTGLDQDEIQTSLTYTVLQLALENAEELTKEFLAGLIGLTAEEFEETPFDTAPEIIRTLIERDKEQFENFTSSVLKIAKNFTK